MGLCVMVGCVWWCVGWGYVWWWGVLGGVCGGVRCMVCGVDNIIVGAILYS